MPSDIPRNCFGFYFYDIYETVDPKGNPIFGPRENVSPMTYFGDPYNLDQIRALNAQDRKFDILLSNMEANSWSRVVKTRIGNWQPLDQGDKVISGLMNW